MPPRFQNEFRLRTPSGRSNDFGVVKTHDNRVRMLRRTASGMSPKEAIELAAWLVYASELPVSEFHTVMGDVAEAAGPQPQPMILPTSTDPTRPTVRIRARTRPVNKI